MIFWPINTNVLPTRTFSAIELLRAHSSDTDSHSLFYRNSADQIQVKADGTPDAVRPVLAFNGSLTILTARLTPTAQELYLNGTLVSSAATAVSDYNLSIGDFWIGNSWFGRIGDVLVYDATPSVNNLGDTGAALAGSYGLTWDPASPLSPVFEPSTMLLAWAGLLGGILSRRR